LSIVFLLGIGFFCQAALDLEYCGSCGPFSSLLRLADADAFTRTTNDRTQIRQSVQKISLLLRIPRRFQLFC
jgi:hypothetical protein